MNGNKKRRREGLFQSTPVILSDINEMINLFGNKSKVADEIDPSIFKGLYNPLEEGRRRLLQAVPVNSLSEDEERWKLTPDVIDPITGQPGDLYGAPTQSSDWWKKEQGYVKDPDTGEWYKPDFPLGSDGGQPTFNPEFHQEMQEEMKRAKENSGRREGNRLREYLKKLIQGSEKTKDERAVLPSQRNRPGVQYV